MQERCHVAVCCPTGVLVSLYSDRLPESEHIVVQTIHSLFGIAIGQQLASYAPPGRLRSYDVFYFEEISLIDDGLWALVSRALNELPQKPVIVLAGDFGQIQPLGASGQLQRIAEHAAVEQVHSEEHVNQRSCDPGLHDFLAGTRSRHPTRAELEAFFEGCMLGLRLAEAVQECVRLSGISQPVPRFSFLAARIWQPRVCMCSCPWKLRA